MDEMRPAARLPRAVLEGLQPCRPAQLRSSRPASQLARRSGTRDLLRASAPDSPTRPLRCIYTARAGAKVPPSGLAAGRALERLRDRGAPASGEQATSAIKTGPGKHELAWREFYQRRFAFPFPGQPKTRLPGPVAPVFPLGERSCSLRAWCEASPARAIRGCRRMRQPQRQRLDAQPLPGMIGSASFLVRKLILDWRWGESGPSWSAWVERAIWPAN